MLIVRLKFIFIAFPTLLAIFVIDLLVKFCISLNTSLMLFG